jgi:hypothetical protein
MKKDNISIDVDKITEGLTRLEGEIAKTISPFILDYITILDPIRQDSINLNHPLTLAQSELLDEYNNLGLEYFKTIDININIENTDKFANFLEVSRNVYLTRFVEARKLFAEYAFYSIPTKEAIKLSEAISPEMEPAVSLELKFPDLLLVEDDGSIILEKINNIESDTDLFKSTLSSYGNLIYLTAKSIRDLMNITTRSFLISMNKDILIELMQVVLQELIVNADRLVYSYIKRGYSTHDSIQNVKSLLEKTTKESGTTLPKAFENIQKTIVDTLDTNLEVHIKLEKEIRIQLREEIMELLVHYCRIGRIISENFYKIKFIEFSKLEDEYKKYHNVIETYLLDNQGDPSNHPVEAYDIDFSRDFKRILFTLVTNDNVNPNLTLEDYLYNV